MPLRRWAASALLMSTPWLAWPGAQAAQAVQMPPATRAQIEADAAEAALALLRLAQTPGMALISWTQGIERHPAEVQRLLEQLMQQADRHMAWSPSLYTYRDVTLLQQQLHDSLGEDVKPEQAPLRAWLAARVAMLPALQRPFSADFASDAREPLRASVLGDLSSLLQQRQARANAQLGVPAATASAGLSPSYFSQGRWAIGWAGGPLAERRKAPPGEGAPYVIAFDGGDVASLAGVFEMAKAQRVAVKASFGVLTGSGHELAQAQPAAQGGIETLRLETRLAAWAVTETGLQPATIRKAVYSGGACAGETPEGTQVEGTLPRSMTGAPLAVFASSAALDPSRARVSVQRRRFLAPLIDLFENTLTDRQTLTVDLDGDGVPDLRVLISTDKAVSRAPLPRKVGYRTVAGWYANDEYVLEANIDGRWQQLSRYAVKTCT